MAVIYTYLLRGVPKADQLLQCITLLSILTPSQRFFQETIAYHHAQLCFVSLIACVCVNVALALNPNIFVASVLLNPSVMFLFMYVPTRCQESVPAVLFCVSPIVYLLLLLALPSCNPPPPPLHHLLLINY